LGILKSLIDFVYFAAGTPQEIKSIRQTLRLNCAPEPIRVLHLRRSPGGEFYRDAAEIADASRVRWIRPYMRIC